MHFPLIILDELTQTNHLVPRRLLNLPHSLDFSIQERLSHWHLLKRSVLYIPVLTLENNWLDVEGKERVSRVASGVSHAHSKRIEALQLEVAPDKPRRISVEVWREAQVREDIGWLPHAGRQLQGDFLADFE